jgi:hypothetical protein
MTKPSIHPNMHGSMETVWGLLCSAIPPLSVVWTDGWTNGWSSLARPRVKLAYLGRQTLNHDNDNNKHTHDTTRHSKQNRDQDPIPNLQVADPANVPTQQVTEILSSPIGPDTRNSEQAISCSVPFNPRGRRRTPAGRARYRLTG